MYNTFLPNLKEELAAAGLNAHIDATAQVLVEPIGDGLFPHLIIAQNENMKMKFFHLTSYGEEIQQRIIALNAADDFDKAWDKICTDVENEDVQVCADILLYITNPTNPQEYTYLALFKDQYCDIKGQKRDFFISYDETLDQIVADCIDRALQKSQAEEIMN